MRDFLDFVGGVVIPFIFILAAGIGIAFVGGGYQCSKYGEVTGRPTKYKGMMCFINDGDRWYSYEEYKLANVAKLKEAEGGDDF